MAQNSWKPKREKAELLFAITTMETLCSGLGRKRTRKANIRPLDQGICSLPNNKRPKRSNLKKSKQSEKGFSGKSLETNLLDPSAPSNSSENTELETTIKCDDATNIQKFLGRGLLEGFVVTCYRQNQDKRDPSDVGTSGKIVGSKIQCFCQDCSGFQYLSTTKFEVHAGCKKKHPADNFYLNDGLTVRDVMNKCKLFPVKSWGAIVSNLIGDLSASKSSSVCMRCKEFIPNKRTSGETTLCSLCLSNEESARSTLCDGASSSRPSHEQYIICYQCEKKYTVASLEEHNVSEPKNTSEDKWFCCGVCKNIQSSLQTMVIGGDICLPQYLVNSIKKKQAGNNSVNKKFDAKWRLLHGNINNGETRDLLSKADSIFHERFFKIQYGNSRDVIPPMVYGMSTGDLDFHGMYCAILSVESKVVCACIIRIFGDDVAELPLVAVETKCQRMGYFQALFSCIEDLLRSLGVKMFLLPAAKKLESMWRNRFGFHRVTNDELMKYQKDYPIMEFKESPMLHKHIIHRTG